MVEKTVVKSNGSVEKFDPKKLLRSLLETFRIAQVPDGQASQFSKKILKEFLIWQKHKPEITTYDIRLKIAKLLKELNPKAAYIFKNFKNII